MSGDLAGSPRINVGLLALGTILSSWIGTTGASMLMIRPIIKMNAWRKHRRHIIVFFIFLVSNMGGCLTPLGDPPLFMGFQRGVPFTIHAGEAAGAESVECALNFQSPNSSA